MQVIRCIEANLEIERIIAYYYLFFFNLDVIYICL